MVNRQLIDPKSIVVIWASNSLHKPGGKLLKNIIDGGFKGNLYAVNPNETKVQGVPCYSSVTGLPAVDLGILAIPAKKCLEVVEVLARHKNTRAFIIISAGFSEESEEGRKLEEQIVKVINEVNGVLIGPNCIGFINENHKSIFTTPVPEMDKNGCDFVSGSGGIALFVIESGIPKGLRFASIYSVGNSSQLGVEEVLEYMDNSYIEGESPKTKLLYIE